MSTFSTIVLVVFIMIAVSYAWGMRGDLIGGEEGAMLPGALLGIGLSLLSGSEFIKDNFLIFMALGMVGTFIGGTEPYSQTIGMFYWGDGFKKLPGEKIGKASAGIMIKGAAWFGIAAAVIGIGYSSMTGLYYQWFELVIIMCALPLMRFAGTRILNYPREVKNGKTPRVYFSKTKPEEWGGLIFMLLTMLAFVIYHKDYFSIIMLVFGTVGGAVGWLISLAFSNVIKVRKKNGKFIFGKLSEKHFIDDWKVMEFGFGALGGLSLALGFVLQNATLQKYAAVIDAKNGIWSPLEDVFGMNLEIAVPAVWLACFAIDTAQHFVSKPKIIRKRSLYTRYEKVKDLFHRPVICYLPMLLIWLGSVKTAQLVAIVLLSWLALEETVFVHFKSLKINCKTPVLFLYAFTIALAAFVWIYPKHFEMVPVFIYVCLLYFVLACSIHLIRSIKKVKEKEKGRRISIKEYVISFGSYLSVDSYYTFCIAFTTIIILNIQ